MTTQLHDSGEEYVAKVVLDGSITRVTSCTVGLYNDTTDALTDANDLTDITTEPTGAAYTRQTINLNATDVTVEQNSGDWRGVFAQTEFDTSDSTQSVDSYFVVINVQLAGDVSATDHLLFTGGLDATYDLTNIDTFRITADTAGISLT